MNISLTGYIIIFCGCIFSKGYGTITGGGSILLQPLLIASGVPPQLAVAHDVAATNACYLASFQKFRSNSSIRYNIVLYSIPGLILGSFLGVYFLTIVSQEFIENFIAILALLVLGSSFFLKIDFGLKELPLPKYHKLLLVFFGFGLGSYMTFSGLGIGTFSTIVLTACFGTTFLQAIAVRPVLHALPTVLGLFSYLALGILDLTLLVVMSCGCAIGGWSGAKFSLAVNEKVLKTIFSTAVIVFVFYILAK